MPASSPCPPKNNHCSRFAVPSILNPSMSGELTKNAHELHPVDFLNRLGGRRATLLLSDGTQITGKIAADVDYSSAFVRMVHISALEGKDFFDAVILKTSITGFIFRNSEGD